MLPQRHQGAQEAPTPLRAPGETFRLYDLRHTCATLLLSRNVHPKYVQELLGHSSVTLLALDTYSCVIPGINGGTAAAMDEALGYTPHPILSICSSLKSWRESDGYTLPPTCSFTFLVA